MVDYYKLLCISRGASKQEIKAAYRKLALLYHPDRHGNDKVKTEHFKQITMAYEFITKGSGVDGTGDPFSRNNRHVYNEQTGRYEPNRSSGSRSGAYTRYTVEEDVGDHVDPRVFNTAMWDAWHYGEDAVIESAVKQTRKIFVDNSCGRYHQKMNKRREEARREAMRVMEAQMAAADQQRREDISARLRKQSEARKQQRSSGNDMSVGRSGESMGRSNSKQKDNSNEEKGNCFVS